MNGTKYWPDDDRTSALKHLAERLSREDIPDVVADDEFVEDLLRTAYFTDEEEHWAEVESEARRLFKVYYGAPGVSRPPGRGEREVPKEIAVEPDEDTLRRAQAFSEVAAVLADNHPQVGRYRRMHLQGRRLTDDEARTLLDRQGGPGGTGIKLKKLLKLAGKLSKTYRWREGDAAWFVLTGQTPPIRPLEVRASVSIPSKHPGRPQTLIPDSSPPRYMAEVPKPSDYHPSTARITVTADAWVNAKEVERAFREAQTQVLAGGDAVGRMSERSLEVIRFVARNTREHDSRPPWTLLWESWNREHPQWRYVSYRGLRQAYERFIQGHIHRAYELPSYKMPEPTPYQTYRDYWFHRRTFNS